jgi:Spy/CpxP family protein refolding chaperone
LTSCFVKADTVADVFDRYDVKNSIKLAERERRTKVTAHTKVFQVIEGRNIPLVQCHAISNVSCQRRVKIRQRKNWGNLIFELVH